MKKTLGNLYGLRTWVEYGFRQCKQELGPTNYRFTKFDEISKWWEIIMNAYLMISLNTEAFLSLSPSNISSLEIEQSNFNWASHLE